MFSGIIIFAKMCKKLPPPLDFLVLLALLAFFFNILSQLYIYCACVCGKRRHEHREKHYIALRETVEKDEVPVKQACYYANTGKVTF